MKVIAIVKEIRRVVLTLVDGRLHLEVGSGLRRDGRRAGGGSSRHGVFVAAQSLSVKFERLTHEFGDAAEETVSKVVKGRYRAAYPQTTTSSSMLPH